MSRIFVHGLGAVSAAGWGVEPLREAIAKDVPISPKPLPRPGWTEPLMSRQVPAPSTKPDFFGHARLRRTSSLSQFVVGACLQALGEDEPLVKSGKFRLGVVSCMMSGCVNYSRRFYDETLRDPAMASPLVFPETVFNAPASHLAALLGTTAMNYTLVGDPGTFLQGLALAAQWLEDEHVDACLVVGGEECDWLTSDSFRLFSRKAILGDGSGALYLKKDDVSGALAELCCITDPHLFTRNLSRKQAARLVRGELPPCSAHHLLVDGLTGAPHLDAAEAAMWSDWNGPRYSPKKILGEGLMAAAAWQCVLAVDALNRNGHTAANVSVVGCNQQAIGAHFAKAEAAA